MRRITITIAEITLEAELNTSPTADTLWEALPLEGPASRWGDEFYVFTGLDIPPSEDAREVMQVGELAYWPGGASLCLFFGRTPVSEGDEPRAYVPVNPCGRILSDLGPLHEAQEGALMRVER